MLMQMQYKARDRKKHTIVHWEGDFGNGRVSTNSLPFHGIYRHLDTLNGTERNKSYRVIPTHLAIEMLELHWNDGKLLFPFATDGLIAFEEPGKPLGPQVEFSGKGSRRMILPTGKYRGQDAALLSFGLSSGDFQESGKDTLIMIPDSRLIPVYDFPKASCKCTRERVLRGPKGEVRDADREAEIEFRRHEGCYVGNIAMEDSVRGRLIRADFRPWDEFVVTLAMEDVVAVTFRGMPRAELSALIEAANAELGGLYGTVRRGRLAALRKLVAALQEADGKEE
jgi:hypothetical protein